MTPNEQAFLDMIAYSEGTSTITESDDGYNVLVGGTLFTGYADHPRILVDLGNGLKSTAAGRYQILERYFDVYKQQLSLPDFGHESQDAIAMQMIGECQALEDIENGAIMDAVTKCSSRWASLPGNNYGQHEQKFADLASAYVRAGGQLTA